MSLFYRSNSPFFHKRNAGWQSLIYMIIFLNFWFSFIIFAVKLFKIYFAGVDHSKTRKDIAMGILRERYVKGEIDAEEFKQKKVDLLCLSE